MSLLSASKINVPLELDSENSSAILARVNRHFSSVLARRPQQRDSDDLSFLAEEHSLWESTRKHANESLL